jgi:hypothetical protein
LQFLGGRVSPPGGERAQLGGELVERWLGLRAQRLPQNLAHFGLGRVPMPRGPALQPSNQFII